MPWGNPGATRTRDALAKATAASEWALVSQLAKELEARRLAGLASPVDAMGPANYQP
jgi:hypothetical protein